MRTQLEQGLLVLADISGFTAFLTATELEHGPAVIGVLLEIIMRRLAPLLEIQEIEGDAVFALGPDRALVRATSVLDALEASFIAFKDRQRQIELNTTCTCNACRNIGNLNLKFIVHHGGFVRQTVGGRPQVAGTDVVLAHKLLKNEVKDTRAYMLLTEPAARRMAIEDGTPGLRRHTEHHGDLGEVSVVVVPLEHVWQRFVQATVARVKRDEALFCLEFLLAVPVATSWEWILAPERRAQYAKELRAVVNEPVPRPGVGTRTRCDHGVTNLVETILDWRPFDYCTREFHITPGNVRLRLTAEFASDGMGTRLTILAAAPPAVSWWQRLLARVVASKIARSMRADIAALQRLLEANVKASPTRANESREID